MKGRCDGQGIHERVETGGRSDVTCAIVAGSILPAATTTICRQSPPVSLFLSVTTPLLWLICRNGMFSALSPGGASGSECWIGGQSSEDMESSDRSFQWNRCCVVSAARTARKTVSFSQGRKEIGHDEVCQDLYPRRRMLPLAPLIKILVE